MRKFFCCISVFFILGILCLGYYFTYTGREEAAPGLTLEQITTGRSVSAGETKGEYGIYYLKLQGDTVVIYENNRQDIYDRIPITLESLPKELVNQLEKGKYIKDEGELYAFLENYSS
nr:hypothetical protein [uncultured Blautia sp.]